MPWTAIDGRRIGAVSSFGFSGTNAHVVVEQAPSPARTESPPGRRPHLLTLSAKDERGLAKLAERYAASLAKRKDEEFADIATRPTPDALILPAEQPSSPTASMSSQRAWLLWHAVMMHQGCARLASRHAIRCVLRSSSLGKALNMRKWREDFTMPSQCFVPRLITVPNCSIRTWRDLCTTCCSRLTASS